MLNKQILNNQNLLVLILTIFSLGINQYYGNKGVFPIEGFAFLTQLTEFFKVKHHLKIIGQFLEFLLIMSNLYFLKFLVSIFKFMFFMHHF